jgi:transposase
MAKSIPNQYQVLLTPEQRERFDEITRNGHAPAKKIRHAQILLWSDGNREGGRLSSREIGERLGMHDNSVDRIRKRFVLEGEQPALERKQRATPAIPFKIDGHTEAHLIAICCSGAPEGHARWTLKLLAGELKKRGFVTSVCAETVRRTLKKMRCSLGVNNAGACPSVTKLASSPRWKTSSTSTRGLTTKKSR